MKRDAQEVQQRKRICIIHPLKDAYSETFIRAHIEKLPAKIEVLYGPSLRYFYTDDDKPLLKTSLLRRLTRAFLRRLLRLQEDYFEKRALKQFLLKNRIGAVLAEFGPTGVSVMEICKQSGVPLIVHFHGYDAYVHATLKRWGAQYLKLFENASAIVVVSRDMENQLLHLGAPPQKVHYNPCGVDISLFAGAEPVHAPPVFIAVGRFVDKKAPYLTLWAFKKLVEKFPNGRLVMIGDGPLLETCRQLSQALEINDRVDFLGARPHVEVAATMQRARAFIQHSVKTSYGDSEGTPVAVLEAGAAGLPVVATRHAGIKDVVINWETGFLVDEGDVEGMADRMVRLALDAELAARLGRAARERISKEFNMDKSIENLWHIIETAIKTNPKHY